MSQDFFNFKNKVVLVTGASGNLGSGITKAFSEAGASLILHYHQNLQAIEKLAQQLTSPYIIVQADLSALEQVKRMFQQIKDQHPQLDVLINNSGSYPVKAFLEMNADEWHEVINSNLTSLFYTSQAAATMMSKGASIINISSIEALYPAYGHSHYSASKAAILMHGRSLAYELGAQGIRVNNISPGLIWREGIEEAWPDGVTRFEQKVPLGRLGTAQDIAHSCLFLASNAASWITGINLIIDGGISSSPAF
ncbi:MAG: SDR family NAD(P)-dependent oxidoreductase [Deinococcales bacterium]